FTRMVNDEIRRLWESKTGYDPAADKHLEAINAKIANVRGAIEDGCDTAWAAKRLQELSLEHQRLSSQMTVIGPPPQVSVEEALSYRTQVDKVFAQGTMTEKKQLLTYWVAEMKLAPETREVQITYRVPEPIMEKVVAGAGFEPATFGL